MSDRVRQLGVGNGMPIVPDTLSTSADRYALSLTTPQICQLYHRIKVYDVTTDLYVAAGALGGGGIGATTTSIDNGTTVEGVDNPVTELDLISPRYYEFTEPG